MKGRILHEVSNLRVGFFVEGLSALRLGFLFALARVVKGRLV